MNLSLSTHLNTRINLRLSLKLLPHPSTQPSIPRNPQPQLLTTSQNLQNNRKLLMFPLGCGAGVSQQE